MLSMLRGCCSLQAMEKKTFAICYLCHVPPMKSRFILMPRLRIARVQTEFIDAVLPLAIILSPGRCLMPRHLNHVKCGLQDTDDMTDLFPPVWILEESQQCDLKAKDAVKLSHQHLTWVSELMSDLWFCLIWAEIRSLRWFTLSGRCCWFVMPFDRSKSDRSKSRTQSTCTCHTEESQRHKSFQNDPET